MQFVFHRKRLSRIQSTFVGIALAGIAWGQNATPTTPADPNVNSPKNATGDAQTNPPVSPKKQVTLGEVVHGAIAQEKRMANLLRNFKPVVETYVQEQRPDPALASVPRNDDYFLSRLDVTGKNTSTLSFTSDEHGGDKKSKSKDNEPFSAAGFAEALFPDLDHFDVQNYDFEFVRWETVGDLRCAVLNVAPKEKTENRGFLGRIWVEDQNYNIVRFTGTFTAKAFAKRSFHFDSWRLNTISIMWTPAYVYTEESDPHDPSHHTLWFKAQTRVWGYDLANAGDHKEYDKRLTDDASMVDPNRHEASQNLNPDLTLGKATYTADDDVVERLQVSGLMAPSGNVNQILETVVNNILVTNDLDIPAVRCRVLLTTPLESFVMGRTIVLSRGLIDVLPDEASLAAVLSHELAHIILNHSTGEKFMAGLTLPFADLEIFSHLNFHFDPAEEAAADKKGIELFGKSPYKDKLAPAELFLEALDARSAQLPHLLHGQLSNDFASSHLVGMTAQAKTLKQLQVDQIDQMAALPLGSRIALDPWSDKIDILKGQAARPASASEKRPFEVGPFYPYLKRLDQAAKAQAAQPAN
jgi:Peptidase family M48